MVEGDRSTFEREWPKLSARVERALRARRVPQWLRDDVIQETGLQMFKIWPQVDHERSPYGLALRIANNLLWEASRRSDSREVLGDVPDRASDHDVERAGLARMELARVKGALPGLSPAHRSILLAEIDGRVHAPGSTPAGTKMMRMRARRRLSALMEQASAVGFVASLHARKRLLQFRTFLDRTPLVMDGGTAFTGLIAAVGMVAGGALAIETLPGATMPGASKAPIIETMEVARPGTLPPPADPRETARVEAPRASSSLPPPAPHDPNPQTYGVGVGEDDGPVDGHATLQIEEDRGPQIDVVPPTCNVFDRVQRMQRARRGLEVSCEGSVEGTSYGANFELRPTPSREDLERAG